MFFGHLGTTHDVYFGKELPDGGHPTPDLVFNSEFSFSWTNLYTKIKSPVYNLPIAQGSITGVLPFPRLFTICEIQTTSFWISTWVAESTSYKTDRYVRSASKINNSIIKILICESLFRLMK